MTTDASGLVAATEAIPTGESTWRLTVSGDFAGPVPGFAFGGYSAAILLRAAGRSTDLPVPLTFTMHYLRPVPVGAELQLRLEQRAGGRRTTSLLLSAAVDGERCLEGLVWVGQPVDGPSHQFGRAPEVRGPDGLSRHDDIISAGGRRPPSTMLRWEKRLSLERPSLDDDGEAEPVYREWSRLTMPPDRDLYQEAARYLLPVDGNPWQAVRHARGLLASDAVDFLMPTLELTAHFHQFDTASEWLLHETVAPVAANGYSSGLTRVWSERGQLLATGISAVTFRST